MLFSSLVFLYIFLPLTLIVYYFLPASVKNYVLLLASLVFFAWGGVSLTAVLVISIILNYVFGIKIQNYIDTPKAYKWLFAGVTVNLVLLAVFKYTNFIVANLNSLFTTFNLPGVPQTDIVLPVGISFYTFHSLSYLVDIYRRKTTAQKNIFNLALYISMFSQLIAGPIIRYSDVWQQLTTRTHNMAKFAYGIERFLIGLAKKILLANTFAVVADKIFNGQIHNLDAPIAWLGILCYSLQIYYDFAGYSDMAIGLGKMFGFHFMENFNFPYIAKSVKEFWRRWHISLSTFFRDYVYIPLGGNRVKPTRAYLNLVIVFFITGFWHGANWTFLLWGLFHGFFMLIERLGFEHVLNKTWKPIANLYTILVAMFAWVLFRCNTPHDAFTFWKGMFHLESSPEQIGIFRSYLSPELITCLAIGILGALGFFSPFIELIKRIMASEKKGALVVSYTYHICSVLVYALIMLMCSVYLVAGTYNPFIYYRF